MGGEGSAALRGVGSTSRRPPKTNPSPKGVYIDYSARPGATRLPIAAQTMRCCKSNFLRISSDDRSGPGILKFQVQTIIFTPIRITRLRLMTVLKPYGFFKTALGISGSGVSGFQLVEPTARRD